MAADHGAAFARARRCLCAARCNPGPVRSKADWVFSGGLVEVPKAGGDLDYFLIDRVEDAMMTLTVRDRHLDVMISIEIEGCTLSITGAVVTHNVFCAFT